MSKSGKKVGPSRREAIGGISAALLVTTGRAADTGMQVLGRDVEVHVTPVSAHTIRLSVMPLEGGKPVPMPGNGTLAKENWGTPTVLHGARTVKHGEVSVQFTPDPMAFVVTDAKGSPIQHIHVAKDTGVVTFDTGTAPVLGMGEGGPQFDRHNNSDNVDLMISGSGGYNLRHVGSHVPVPWLIGTAGWAMFFNQPYGRFDFTGEQSKFTPASTAPRQGGRGTPPPPPPTPAEAAAFSLPLDIFVVASNNPATIMGEYSVLTGLAEFPPLWSFGYQQSHRTLAGREAILQEVKTFREKKLPCDAMIYLGTGFCPAGWNTNNGEFTFNDKVMPDPKVMFDEIHKDNMKVVLHVAYPTGIREMGGTVNDKCDPARRAETQASCYWDMHKPVLAQGVDGWWPDEGDALNLPSRLVRNRMYWDAYQKDRPNERPYALHRNGAAGMQRYASFLWSGDINSQWETLKNQVAVGINTGLTGIPYWGTDIGGFVPTSEFTGELYARWFQFGAFCPLFRSHGRVWTLRLPWGWNEGAPTGLVARETPFTIPDAEYHNAAIEPICKKYLELRYRMMPYLYSAVRETTKTGLPVIRSLWLHYPEDRSAVARGDEYLWGRDILVAPIFEKGATNRKVYLPRGTWYDFWTNEKQPGAMEVVRTVDLATMPLYVRAGAIIPMGPLKQYTGEKVDGPLEVSVYPGADGSFLLYEDDGETFKYKTGEWMGVQMAWNDARQTLSLRLAPGSKMLGPARRDIVVKSGAISKNAVFEGRPLEIALR